MCYLLVISLSESDDCRAGFKPALRVNATSIVLFRVSEYDNSMHFKLLYQTFDYFVALAILLVWGNHGDVVYK